MCVCAPLRQSCSVFAVCMYLAARYSGNQATGRWHKVPLLPGLVCYGMLAGQFYMDILMVY